MSMTYPSYPTTQPVRNAKLRHQTHADLPNCLSYLCSSACLEHARVGQELGEHDERLRELLHPIVSFAN
jgi:hypothetical protein